jgi:hypothetical protein
MRLKRTRLKLVSRISWFSLLSKPVFRGPIRNRPKLPLALPMSALRTLLHGSSSDAAIYIPTICVVCAPANERPRISKARHLPQFGSNNRVALRAGSRCSALQGWPTSIRTSDKPMRDSKGRVARQGKKVSVVGGLDLGGPLDHVGVSGGCTFVQYGQCADEAGVFEAPKRGACCHPPMPPLQALRSQTGARRLPQRGSDLLPATRRLVEQSRARLRPLRARTWLRRR